MMESGPFVKGCEHSAAGQGCNMRDNVKREGSSETAWTARAWCKSWVEGHIFTQGKKLTTSQGLRQPLRMSMAVLTVRMYRNACHSVNDRLPQRSRKGLLFPS